ncbi:MAG: cation:proton antiporter, partial [Planctomycetes bacterium]|nr:cation:proton antiporter [Planctomycetota bacterium]
TLILGGLFQFPLCIAFGYGAGLLLQRSGWDLAQGPYLPIYIGFTLASSSTLIVVKLLQSRYQLDTVVGRVALGILVFQDLWAIVVLAVQPNFAHPELGQVGLTLLGIAILTGLAILLARYALPLLLHWIAKEAELMLVVAIAWCFGIAFLGQNLATILGLLGIPLSVSVSLEMGALLAGASIAALPFCHEMAAKVGTVRDFFVTLFFVGLGMGIPRPEGANVLLFALALAALTVASRYLIFFPLLYLTGMDRRSSVVASTRLAQISEFCLVIAFLGLQLGHVSNEFVSAVIFAFVITALATPLIFDVGDRLHERLGGLLSALGFRLPDRLGTERAAREHAIVILGCHRIASSFLHEIARSRPEVLKDILVVDFNVAIHSAIRRLGVTVVYGDVSNPDTLKHAVEHADLVISTVQDDILKGTTNAKLAAAVRAANGSAKIIVNAYRAQMVEGLYAAGADYVFVTRVEAARNLLPAVEAAMAGRIRDYRAEQDQAHGAVADRVEVLP